MRRIGHWMVIALAACSGHTPVGPQVTAVLDDTFTLRVGQQVSFGTEPLRLTFEAVSEDSRCPVDVVCVWAGNAQLRLRASMNGGDAQTIALNTTVAPRAVSVHGYEIKLDKLEPHPTVAHRIRQEDYVAYLMVSRD